MIEFSHLLRRAADAFPVSVFPAPPHERDGGDDWGSERQIEAENGFFEALQKFISQGGLIDFTKTWDAFETFCLKATTDERIKEGVRIALLADRGEDEIVNLIAEYYEWCKAHKLPCISADEHEEEKLTGPQRKWLADFRRRWAEAA